MFEQFMSRLQREMLHQPSESEIQLAVAALLVAADRADVAETKVERSIIEDALVHLYRCSRDEAVELADCGAKVEEACVELKDITNLIKTHLDKSERERLLAEVWQVFVADYTVSVREKSFARRLSTLLGVSPQQATNIQQEAMTKQAS